MWKKPTIQKPDFLNNLSENECLEVNGGKIELNTSTMPTIPKLSGMVAPPIPITPIPPKLSGVIAKPFDIIDEKIK